MEDTTATEAETPIYTRTELKSAMNFAVVRTLNALRSRYCFELMAAGLLKTGASVEGAQRFLKWLDEFISIGVEPEEGVIGVARAARIDWAMLKRERGRGTFSREQWELWTALTCQRFKPEEEGKS